MSKTKETIDIEHLLRKYTAGQFGCDEVTICVNTWERVDYITLNWKGDWRCFEIKVSKPDFHSKAHKTFVGNLNYFVMPITLYAEVKDDIPDGIGVLVSNGLSVESTKRAKRQPLQVDEKHLMTCMIRSLSRTYERVKDSESVPEIEKYQRRISRLEGDLRREKNRNYSAVAEAQRMNTFLYRYKLDEKYEEWLLDRIKGGTE